MANPTRVLFVSGEVAPFAQHTELAELVRLLPERLQEHSNYDMRIMMPRYGNVSERRNRLHEVIRLSGTEVKMGDSSQTLRVKVASIPGIRLQVYFLDNAHYFKRKGILADKAGKAFDDNADRALFFARACMTTIRNLGWAPDVIHSFGWMSTLMPYLVRTEGGDDPLYTSAKLLYTPNEIDLEDTFTAAEARKLGLPQDDRLLLRNFHDIAMEFADELVCAPVSPVTVDGALRFSTDPEEITEQAMDLYLPPVKTIAA